MIEKRAVAHQREMETSKGGRDDLGRHLSEFINDVQAEGEKQQSGVNKEFDVNFDKNNKNTRFSRDYMLQRKEDQAEFDPEAKEKSMLRVNLNLQEHSIADKSVSKSDPFCVYGSSEQIEENTENICEEITKENDNEIKKNTNMLNIDAKCDEVTHVQRSTSNNNKKMNDVSGCRRLPYFCGWSKYKGVFVTYVWLLTTLTAVSAAPSFFDGSGRSSFDPFKCGCSGGGSKRARVVGGSELTQGSAPWLAAITKSGKSHCGAALVSRDHLLTAAHCIDGLHLDELRGWLGVHALSDAQSSGKGRKFRDAHPHPQFEYSGFHNDIALLELQNSVQFSSSIRPVCLPSRADVEYASRTAIVAGWGRTAENDPPSDIPRQALVQVWTKAKCRGAGYPAKRVAGEVLCAGLPKGGVDACQGDSGGPLVLEGSHGSMEVIGVVSWGRGCARPNLPGIYTRVASYLPFIQNIIEESCT